MPLFSFHRFSLPLLAMGVLCVAFRGIAQEPAAWHKTLWNGEKAWMAAHAGWIATVSEERARLISLAPVNGRSILFADTREAISWGGHRFWLGPQEKWFLSWPPPADWEASAAALVTVSGGRLELAHPHTDARYPQIARAYFWKDGVLHCEARWRGEPYYAIQILQVPQWSLVHVRGEKSTAFPSGYGLPTIFRRPAKNDGEIARGVVRRDGDRLTLWHANVAEKIGVPAQEIVAEIGEFRLAMRPGQSSGISSRRPEGGMLTQVFLGDWENPFIEIEQLSGYGGETPSVFEILIEPSRAKE